MGRLIDTSHINNCVMMHKSDWGIFATAIDNIIGSIVMECSTVEAIPKAEYEARLADMYDKDTVAWMFRELQLDIEKLNTPNNNDAYMTCSEIIQQKINSLKG